VPKVVQRFLDQRSEPVESTSDHDLVLQDGRRLAWREFGDPAGVPVLALHGTPGSRLKFEITDRPARALGLGVVAPDRWGYGATHPHRAPSLAAFAADVRELADALAIARFAVLGVSGGGPYAAAVATCLPQRVSALALFAPVGPIAGEAIAMSVFHGFCFGRFARSRWAPRATFATFGAILRASPQLGMAIAMSRAGSADRAILAAGASGRLSRTFAEGLRRGPDGPSIDMLLFGRAWELPLAAATAPARLWLGSQDRHVPHAAARLLASRLPACIVTDLPDAGHLWIAENYSTVLGWIAETARSGPDGWS
jgi:pimeloyl-ACP methyl ester carboxylesterase